MARRSRLHPGTRYLARGINSCSGTGEMLPEFHYLFSMFLIGDLYDFLLMSLSKRNGSGFD